MDKYFQIKQDCCLYKDYFAWLEDDKKLAAAFIQTRKKFGIEAEELYPSKKQFQIVPTRNDKIKFADMLKKSNYGEFKKNSEVARYWCELVKNIEHFERPRMWYYFKLLGHRWRERVFDINGVLYCSISSNGEVFTPDFAIEMKASEFFKIIEDYEAKKSIMTEE